MTAKNINAGAPTDIVTQWHNINWARCRREVEEAAGAYREGNTGGESGQGKSLAMATHPLVQRQSNGS
ncbi:hypothetical protein ECZC10_48500 [Escherichia coli]|nr:hypothetical protein ECZC10_48500 [Escherichia coli]